MNKHRAAVAQALLGLDGERQRQLILGNHREVDRDFISGILERGLGMGKKVDVTGRPAIP
ncbi:MAG TPA: hypothetical protein QF901_09570 [Gammaproteobacteria bacterium]|nr:hypothetical protein [Gammaproteobacteria bacterium]